MERSDQPRPERIRALIEEVDRLCRECEDVADAADLAMKRAAFWPERRKAQRPSACPPARSHRNRGDAA